MCNFIFSNLCYRDSNQIMIDIYLSLHRFCDHCTSCYVDNTKFSKINIYLVIWTKRESIRTTCQYLLIVILLINTFHR